MEESNRFIKLTPKRKQPRKRFLFFTEEKPMKYPKISESTRLNELLNKYCDDCGKVLYDESTILFEETCDLLLNDKICLCDIYTPDLY